MRPVLTAAARRLWREEGTLQLGLPPARAVLVEGLQPEHRQVLALLDGVRTHEQVVTAAADLGCHDAAALLTLLDANGLLLDADSLVPVSPERDERDRLAPDLAALTLVHGPAAPQALRSRRSARVVVHGAGRVGGPLAALLDEAGVGTVDVRDAGTTRLQDTAVGGLRAEDVGRSREQALAGRLRCAPSYRPPSLVVLTDEPPAEVSRVLVRDGIPHLLARVEGTVGVVGPLVRPGHGPCLRCLDLVRTAIDPGWPALVSQRDAAPGVEASDGVLAAAVASQAALQVLQLLEGGTPASEGGTLELEVPGWRWRRRTWPQHPGCECVAHADWFPAIA